jgi:integrase
LPATATIRITESVRSVALRRPLKPSATRDAEIAGLCLIVTTRRAFWAFVYQPRGVNPATGKRWGGGVRHELCDAMMMPVSEARAAALAAKSQVRQGRSPHHEAMASRGNLEASRAIIPTTVAEALETYAKALAIRSTPSEYTRKQSLRYARKAIAFMNVAALPVAAVSVPMVRLLAETVPGSGAERVHVYGALNRFMGWCRKQSLIETNPCDALDRHDRPRPSKAREHVPSIETLQAVWHAVEDEWARDLVRFLLLLPLRRREAAGLTWSEVDLDQGRVRISAARMKARQLHELSLAKPAFAILVARKLTATGDLVFPSSEGAPFSDWGRLLTRIRARIGESRKARDDRFSFHDIRRGFVSHLAEVAEDGGFDLDLLDQVLAHTRRGVFGTYQKSSRWAERVRAINRWSVLIAGAEPDINVVPIRARS